MTLSVLKGSISSCSRITHPVVRNMAYATTGVFVVMLRTMNTILKSSLVPNQNPNGYRNAPWNTSRKWLYHRLREQILNMSPNSVTIVSGRR